MSRFSEEENMSTYLRTNISRAVQCRLNPRHVTQLRISSELVILDKTKSIFHKCFDNINECEESVDFIENFHLSRLFLLEDCGPQYQHAEYQAQDSGSPSLTYLLHFLKL